jgi:hypothetical protein
MSSFTADNIEPKTKLVMANGVEINLQNIPCGLVFVRDEGEYSILKATYQVRLRINNLNNDGTIHSYVFLDLSPGKIVKILRKNQGFSC